MKKTGIEDLTLEELDLSEIIQLDDRQSPYLLQKAIEWLVS